jgi:hypothetical protein
MNARRRVRRHAYAIITVESGDVYGNGLWDTREDAEQALSIADPAEPWCVVRVTYDWPQP